MTGRFKNKLEYQASEPSFLRKLRATQAGVDQDRHERPIPRPRKAKDVDDEDDEPTYIDEESNRTLSKDEFAALVNGEQPSTRNPAEDNAINEGCAISGDSLTKSGEADQVDDKQATRARQDVIQAGKQQKKRKAVKVVGDDDDDDAGERHPSKEENDATSGKKQKRKAKAVILSFGDDGD